MEPIPEDIVERAEDFFFKLDDKQVVDFFEEYKKKQPWVHRFILVSFNFIKLNKYHILLSRFLLLIDFCYQSYPLIFPIIERSKVGEYMKDETIKQFSPLKPGSEHVDTNQSYLLVEQIYLTEVLKSKESLYDDEANPLDKKIAGEIWLTMITVLNIYQDMAKKEMDKINK